MSNTTIATVPEDGGSNWLDIMPKTLISFVILGAIVAIAIIVAKGLDVWNERMEDSDSDMSEFTRNLLRMKIKLIFGARLFGFGQVKGKKRKFTKDERKAVAIKLARQWRDYVRKINKERKAQAAAGGAENTGDNKAASDGGGKEKKESAPVNAQAGKKVDPSAAAKAASNIKSPSTVVQIDSQGKGTPTNKGQQNKGGIGPPSGVRREKTHDGDFIAIELSPASEQTIPKSKATLAPTTIQPSPSKNKQPVPKSVAAAIGEQTSVFVTPVQPNMSTAVESKTDDKKDKDQLSIHSDFSSIVSYDNAVAETDVQTHKNSDAYYGVRLADKDSFDKNTQDTKNKASQKNSDSKDPKSQTKYVRPVTASKSRPITAGGRESNRQTHKR